MSKIALYIISALFIFEQIIYVTEGHIFRGRCPNLSTAEGFKISQIQGNWREVESFGDEIEVALSKCNAVKFTKKSDDVLNVDYSRYVRTQGTLHNKGYAQLISKGKFLMTLNLPVVGLQTFPYSILGIEPNKYVVAWTCTEFIFFNIQKVWVLSRSGELDDTSSTKVNNLLQKNGFDEKKFTKVSQSDCTY